MPNYNAYGVLSVLNGTVTVGLPLGGTNVTDNGSQSGDLSAVFGDIANDRINGASLLPENYSGLVQDGNGNVLGFYSTSLNVLNGTVAGYNVYSTQQLTTGATYTTVPRTEVDQTQWNSATNSPYCFMAGTQIATPAGERPVEALKIGDEVLTASGEVREVRWVGRQTVIADLANPVRDYPIRVCAGALGEGLPTRDLKLSPDHGLLLDGVLVQAGALVNGMSIDRVMSPPKVFTYYHIELEDHSLILADSVPAETFVDNVTRRNFDNYAEYEALYISHGPHIAEMDVPRVKALRQLPRHIKSRLTAQAEALGFVTTIAA